MIGVAERNTGLDAETRAITYGGGLMIRIEPDEVRVRERKVSESRIDNLEFKPDKKAIRAKLKRGTQIRGADLKFGDWRLVIT
jgi:hypothetical protein